MKEATMGASVLARRVRKLERDCQIGADRFAPAGVSVFMFMDDPDLAYGEPVKVDYSLITAAISSIVADADARKVPLSTTWITLNIEAGEVFVSGLPWPAPRPYPLHATNPRDHEGYRRLIRCIRVYNVPFKDL
jgi:hypothetical protein